MDSVLCCRYSWQATKTHQGQGREIAIKNDSERERERSSRCSQVTLSADGRPYRGHTDVSSVLVGFRLFFVVSGPCRTSLPDLALAAAAL